MQQGISRMSGRVVVSKGLHASLLSRADTRLAHILFRCWGRLMNSHFLQQRDLRLNIVRLREVRVALPCIWIRALIARVELMGYRWILLDSLPTNGWMVSLSNLNHPELHSRSYLELVIERACTH